MEHLTLNLLFALTASAIAVVSFVTYVKGMFQGKTKPHVFTWLVWLVTQGTAVGVLWYGGGGVGALSLTIGVLFMCFILLNSFRYGSRNIRPVDGVVLGFALLGIFFWWQLDSPLLAVITASIVDVLGYIPTYRKTYEEPTTEQRIPWSLGVLSNVFALLALQEYNLLTMTYIVSILLANTLVVLIITLRRRTAAPIKKV